MKTVFVRLNKCSKAFMYADKYLDWEPFYHEHRRTTYIYIHTYIYETLFWCMMPWCEEQTRASKEWSWKWENVKQIMAAILFLCVVCLLSQLEHNKRVFRFTPLAKIVWKHIHAPVWLFSTDSHFSFVLLQTSTQLWFWGTWTN